MSNINIPDHHFYFKTQRGRIKSQPINSEVSHYHLRLLLGNKEAPWWWPLKAPYGVFASLGHKIKAWVRGVGFLMFPLERCVPARGWLGEEGEATAVLGITHASALLLGVNPEKPGGTGGWVLKGTLRSPCRSWLHYSQVHMWKESWFTEYQPPVEVSLWPETTLWMRRQKLLWHLYRPEDL